MEVTELTREFRFNGTTLVDINPAWEPEAVRRFYSETYPELTNAIVKGPDELGTTLVYTFQIAVGTKG